MKSFMVTGGGTGGHLFPGIAVAAGLRERFPESRLVFVGAGRPVDRRVLAGRAFEVASIRCPIMKGTSPGAKIKALALLPMAYLDAARVVRRHDPDLVIGVGGYASGPVVLAARMLGKRTCIHEQNSVPGVTNRLLGHVVDKIFLSMPGSEDFFPPGKTLLTGNPLRRELVDAAGRQSSKHGDECAFTLLVLGGSQGARRLNELVPAAMISIKQELPSRFSVIHQCGAADEDLVATAYRQGGIQAEVMPFIDDMAKAYGKADIIVSRAGATALAEIALFGIPAVLVPYPYAADDHQTKNALVLVEAGGALMLEQQGADAAAVAREILTLVRGEAERKEMGIRLRQLARPEAAESIVTECVALLEKGSRRRMGVLDNGKDVRHYV